MMTFPDLIALFDRRVLVTHAPKACSGEHCCIHNPSDHPLNTAPLDWREDRRLMERICEHGIGHPDPDSVAHLRRTIGDNSWEDHGCDGCCHGGRM